MSISASIKNALPEGAFKDFLRNVKAHATSAQKKNLPKSEYEAYIKSWYKRTTGFEFDLDNPQTLNEKIQWLKLNDSTPQKGQLADKYLVREWVESKIGLDVLVPLLGVWDDPADIDFDELPDQFVLKATHGSGWNVIVPNKAELNRADARKKLKRWLSYDFAFVGPGLELHYQYCEPRVMCEQYLDFGGGASSPIDYRFFCSWGEVFSVWEDVDSGTPHHCRNIYTPAWEPVEVIATWPPFESAGKPSNYQQMLEYASTLSAEFAFVRVDFYEYEGRTMFGEMTFTPMSGTAKFDPPEADLEFGKYVDLSRLK